MNKELKALSRIKKDEFYVLSHYEYNDDSERFEPVYEKTDGLSRIECFKIVRQSLIKAQEQEKVLKILFEKRVDMWHLVDLLEQDYEMYLAFCKSEKYAKDYILTKKEFDLLKRISVNRV